MNSPLVSVLIPAYNRADYIGEAIQSVLDQSFRDLEIVVVDDGSSDHTARVVERFTDARVRLIRQANRGISCALNTAFRASHGRYIALLGSDDVWLPNLLLELAPILNARPEIGLVYARAQAMDAAGRLLPRLVGAPEKYPGQTFKSLLYGDHICTIAALCRREEVERIGLFDESLVANEDWDLWLRLARVCRFLFVDNVLARVRMHGGRITGRASERWARVLSDRVRVLDKVYAASDLPRELVEFKPLAYANVYVDLGLRWRGVSARNSLSYFRRAVQTSPRPLATLARILYLVLFYDLLSKHEWGTRLVNTWVRHRRIHTIERTISELGEVSD